MMMLNSTVTLSTNVSSPTSPTHPVDYLSPTLSFVSAHPVMDSSVDEIIVGGTPESNVVDPTTYKVPPSVSFSSEETPFNKVDLGMTMRKEEEKEEKKAKGENELRYSETMGNRSPVGFTSEQEDMDALPEFIEEPDLHIHGSPSLLSSVTGSPSKHFSHLEEWNEEFLRMEHPPLYGLGETDRQVKKDDMDLDIEGEAEVVIGEVEVDKETEVEEEVVEVVRQEKEELKRGAVGMRMALNTFFYEEKNKTETFEKMEGIKEKSPFQEKTLPFFVDTHQVDQVVGYSLPQQELSFNIEENEKSEGCNEKIKGKDNEKEKSHHDLLTIPACPKIRLDADKKNFSDVSLQFNTEISTTFPILQDPLSSISSTTSFTSSSTSSTSSTYLSTPSASSSFPSSSMSPLPLVTVTALPSIEDSKEILPLPSDLPSLDVTNALPKSSTRPPSLSLPSTELHPISVVDTELETPTYPKEQGGAFEVFTCPVETHEVDVRPTILLHYLSHRYPLFDPSQPQALFTTSEEFESYFYADMNDFIRRLKEYFQIENDVTIRLDNLDNLILHEDTDLSRANYLDNFWALKLALYPNATDPLSITLLVQPYSTQLKLAELVEKARWMVEKNHSPLPTGWEVTDPIFITPPSTMEERVLTPSSISKNVHVTHMDMQASSLNDSSILIKKKRTFSEEEVEVDLEEYDKNEVKVGENVRGGEGAIVGLHVECAVKRQKYECEDEVPEQ